MVNRRCAALGLGLMIAWVVGLSSPVANSWINWMDGLAGIVSLIVAAFMPLYASRRVRSLAPGLISLGLMALWIVGMSTGVVAWQRWVNFLFALAFGMLSLVVAFERRAPRVEDESDRFRKSA